MVDAPRESDTKKIDYSGKMWHGYDGDCRQNAFAYSKYDGSCKERQYHGDGSFLDDG